MNWLVFVILIWVIVGFGSLAAWLGQEVLHWTTSADSGRYFWLVAGGIAVGFAACVGVIWLVTRIERRALRRRRRLRLQRLKRIADDPTACRRLPHRYIEWILFHTYFPFGSQWKTYKKHLRHVIAVTGPGHVIINSLKPREQRIMPAPSDRSFEPISIKDRKAVREWVRMTLDAQGLSMLDFRLDREQGEFVLTVRRPIVIYESKTGELPASVRTTMRLGNSVGKVGCSIVFLLCVAPIVWLAGSIIQRFARGAPTTSDVIFTVGLSVALAVVVIRNTLGGTRTWLVPAGRITAKHRLWWRRIKVEYYTRRNSVYFTTSGKTYIIHDKCIKIIDANWAQLAAWISTATPPTPEAVLAFVGPDSEPATK